MAVTYLFAGVAVADLDTALAWHERLWNRPPDLIPHEREACWQLADSSWIYVVEDAERAGSSLLTVLVDDLDRVVGELAERGLATGRIETLGSGARKAEIADPEGNRIGFGEAP